MTEQPLRATNNAPEKFTVGEWVDFRERIKNDSWEGASGLVAAVNGLEVTIHLHGDPQNSMVFFPRRSDNKHVRIYSKHGPVPDYEFYPTWIYHGKVSETFTENAKRIEDAKRLKDARTHSGRQRTTSGNVLSRIAKRMSRRKLMSA